MVLDNNRPAGIVDRLCEIANPLEGAGHVPGLLSPQDRRKLPTQHEERSVMAVVEPGQAERTGDNPAKLILMQYKSPVVEERPRVETDRPEVLEQRAV